MKPEEGRSSFCAPLLWEQNSTTLICEAALPGHSPLPPVGALATGEASMSPRGHSGQRPD